MQSVFSCAFSCALFMLRVNNVLDFSFLSPVIYPETINQEKREKKIEKKKEKEAEIFFRKSPLLFGGRKGTRTHDLSRVRRTL